MSLFLAGSTTVYLLKNEQENSARERVGLIAERVARDAVVLQANGFTDPTIIQQALEEVHDVRILLTDTDGTVYGDSARALRGQIIDDLAQQGVQTAPLEDLRYSVSRFKHGPENLLLFRSSGTVLAAVPGVPVAYVPRYQAAVAVEASDVSQAWREMIPRLLFAGGIAAVVGVVSASLLARSITRPLKQITSASEEMARGNYDQNIPGYGGEEVSRLAAAFNNMASQVSYSHRTLKDFLANVSHELKTPLTSIQGFSQAMIEGALQKPEDYTEAARIINDEAIRMRGLVDDLLYLSQVEAGQVILQREALNPGELLLETAERFRRRAGKAGVSIEATPGPNPVVYADPRRLEQAVANLVDNAVRHTPVGGHITLQAGVRDGEIRLSVHNTGSYIEPEAMPRIFERFFQVDPVKSRANGNTGLGLAITREIVEGHGGSVEVSSAPGQGTEFVISLPLRPAQARDGQASSTTEVGEGSI